MKLDNMFKKDEARCSGKGRCICRKTRSAGRAAAPVQSMSVRRSLPREVEQRLLYLSEVRRLFPCSVPGAGYQMIADRGHIPESGMKETCRPAKSHCSSAGYAEKLAQLRRRRPDSKEAVVTGRGKSYRRK